MDNLVLFDYIYYSQIKDTHPFKNKIFKRNNFTYCLSDCTLIPGTYFIFCNESTCIADFIPVDPTLLERTVNDFPGFYSCVKLGTPLHNRVTNRLITTVNVTPFSSVSTSQVSGRWLLISQSFDDRNVYHFLHICLPTFKRVLEANPLVENFCFLYQPSVLQVMLFRIFFPHLSPIYFDLPSEVAQRSGYPRVGITFEQIAAGCVVKSSLEDLIWIRDELLKFVSNFRNNTDVFNQLPKRVYISRRDVKTSPRSLSNETEIESLVANYGFKSVAMTDFSVTQQIMLFHYADVIIFDHGAAGAWIPASGDHTKIIELISPRNSSTSREIATVYKEMCSLLRIRHRMIVGEFCDLNTASHTSLAPIKYKVPIDKLLKAIMEL